MKVNQRRVRKLNTAEYTGGPIVYWMSRDQRIQDNWALIYAQELAIQHKQPLAIVHNLKANYLGGGLRQFDFKLKGLQEVEKRAQQLRVPFMIFHGVTAEKDIAKFVKKEQIGAVVTDFSPLRINRAWVDEMAANISVPFFEVDAHNIVPCWLASPKQEFAARTFRPKIHKLLPEFLEEFPALRKHPHMWNQKIPHVDWKLLKTEGAKGKKTIPPVTWLTPGEEAANAMCTQFLTERFQKYHEKRNDPNANALSGLSPYLHYGHISAQRVALQAQQHDESIPAQEAFLEELIVRRELADNFCFYNPQYDSFQGFPEWAQKTLNAHRADKREYLYTQTQFEQADTHDALWNAAQNEMVHRGKMHGYMRMYWAKKILEWSESPEEAMKTAIYLNDRYELDGRDPNGYTGIAWSIGGVHDRPWFDRPIFGLVRYMSSNGIKKKFSVDQYIANSIIEQ